MVNRHFNWNNGNATWEREPRPAPWQPDRQLWEDLARHLAVNDDWWDDLSEEARDGYMTDAWKILHFLQNRKG